jgi:Domain of unknown function (DUF4136)
LRAFEHVATPFREIRSMLARRSFALFGALGLVALAGCASDDLQTSTVFDPLSQFPAQATYSWDTAANRLPSDDRIAALDLDPLIRKAADEEFALRGYRVVASGSPDYRLSYQVTVSSWIGSDNSTSVASLSLLLVDAKRDRRVWMGYGRAEIHVGSSREERQERLRAAMAKMLAEFPPNQADR